MDESFTLSDYNMNFYLNFFSSSGKTVELDPRIGAITIVNESSDVINNVMSY